MTFALGCVFGDNRCDYYYGVTSNKLMNMLRKAPDECLVSVEHFTKFHEIQARIAEIANHPLITLTYIS